MLRCQCRNGLDLLTVEDAMVQDLSKEIKLFRDGAVSLYKLIILVFKQSQNKISFSGGGGYAKKQ